MLQAYSMDSEGSKSKLRENFPERGTNYQGGVSDGWQYRVVFAGGTFKKSYAMIVAFLREEGYGDLPLPASVEELKLFRFQKRSQMIRLFEENGYLHNPIKILFPPPGTEKRGSLILCIFNEEVEGHLVRFHGVGI